MCNKNILSLVFLIFSQISYAQIKKPTKPASTSNPSQSVIDTSYFSTPEGITSKMLELISVPQGQNPNWEEYRMLFLPNAQKIYVNPKAPKGRQVRNSSLEEFIRNTGPLYGRDGFEEIVIGQSIDEYNGIAQVFQSFYCKNLIGTYENRGINTYQLVYADDRWWITSVTFTNETKSNPIPSKYLFSETEEKNNQSDSIKKVKYKLPKSNNPMKKK